jgi:uncharacterized protein
MFHRRTYIAMFSFSVTAMLLFSCASYNKQARGYYDHLRKGEYEKASISLDNTKLLKKERNRLLFLLERGKVSHLLGQWDSSNTYLNEADYIMENAALSAKDIAVGTLINPMMQKYRAEAFEKYLVHYYKALNYLQMNQPQEAMVEARRISLRTYQQEDVTGKNKYADDAFSFMLQGMIYEKNSDNNNAFIAYRNAIDVFLKNNGSYYDTKMPEQLKKDLLRTAFLNGFTDELNRYEKILNITYTNEKTPEGGELILFWENGAAPVKVQQNNYFSLFKDAGNSYYFRDAGGFYNIPFNQDYNSYNNNVNLSDLSTLRVALPKYETQPPFYNEATLQINNSNINLEQVENINTLAFSTLQERLIKELASTLTRLAVKKLAEAAIRPNNKKEINNKKIEENKNDEKKDNQREAIALGIQIFNYASEKADTRNWQSLPNAIFYARIPLQKGENKITLQLNGLSTHDINILAFGTGGLQFQNICTLK